MSRARRGGLSGLLFAAIAATSAGPGVAAPDLAPLVLSASGPAFAGGGVQIEVAQHGFLAGQRITLLFFVDGDLADRVTTDGGPTVHRLRHPRLVAGRHRIRVKSGSESAGIEVLVLPAWSPAAGVGAVAGAALLFALARRRRRAS